MQKLTSLALDTIGTQLPGRRMRYAPPQRHLCAMLKEFVVLRVLKVRMEYICAEVFLVGGEENSRIEEIEVNIGLRDQAGGWSPNTCVCCNKPSPNDEIWQVLIDAGKEAVVRCKRLRRCLVLADQYHPTQSRWDLVAVDCHTGGRKVCWNDETSKGIMGVTPGGEYDGWDLDKTWDENLEMFL